MLKFDATGKVKIGNTTYIANSIVNGKLIMKATTQYGVYFTDAKNKVFSRKITNGCVTIDGKKVSLENC